MEKNTSEMENNSTFDPGTIVKEELIIEDELVPSEEELQSIPNSNLSNKRSEYRCETCDLTFPTNSQHNSHVRIHKPSSFVCSICLKTFKDKFQLIRHVKVHERSKNLVVVGDFMCHHCDKVFQELCLYRKHLQTSCPLPFKCNLCPKSFLELNILRKHEQLVHNIPIPNAENPADNPDGSVYCDECGKTLKSRRSYVGHLLRHKYIKEGTFRCVPCDKSFGDNGALVMHKTTKQHLNNVDPNDLVEAQCQLCNKVFRSQTPHFDLSRHQKAVHGGVTVSSADVQVEPNFYSETIVKEELIIDDVFNPVNAQEVSQSGVPSEPETVFCPVCDKSFTCNRKYYMHQRRHRNLAYTCSICQKSFMEKFELDRHASKVHRERPKREFLEALRCSQCDKTFSLERLYKLHMARHGARIFKCALCPKSFALKNDLDKHERNIHKIVPKKSSGEESPGIAQSAKTAVDPTLQCVECDKFYTLRCSYLAHMRKHRRLKEGAYKCETCQKTFSTNYNLTLHVNGIQHKHKVKNPAKCEICQLVFPSHRKLLIHKKDAHSGSSSTVTKIHEGGERELVEIEAESD